MQLKLENDAVFADALLKKIEKKFHGVMRRSYDKIPYTAVNGVHTNQKDIYINMWTNGFWGGILWLMYIQTNDVDYKNAAIHSEHSLNAALKKYIYLDHDIGFIWIPTTGIRHRLTGEEEAKEKYLYLASVLASRYNVDGKYIIAWNTPVCKGWSIIDTMMNIPMLYRASELINSDRFRRIAIHHSDMVLRDHIREDGAVNHIVEHDVDSGEIKKIIAGQGYSEKSCWSRGAAWAIYGMAIGYKYTGYDRYLEAAKKVSEYFLKNCKKTDYKTLCDFNAPEEPIYYDSTAGAIAACGLLEVSNYICGEERRYYRNQAKELLRAIDKNFCNYDEKVDYLVGMGTERYPVKEEYMRGVHIPIIYGDYFFIEALLKLKDENLSVW